MDPSSLPVLFHDDTELEKSALLAKTLVSAIDKVIDNSVEDNSIPARGSLGYAREQLEIYLNMLDNKIVSHFDAAADAKDLPGMAYYARIMKIAHGESISGYSLLVSRYISRNPIFLNPKFFFEKLDLDDRSQAEDIPIHAMIDSPGHVEASRRITMACRLLGEYIRDEAAVLEQLFDDSGKAISLFTTRIFEETMAEAIALSFTLARYDQEKDVKTLRDSLRSVSESYRKVLNVAEESCQLMSNEMNHSVAAIELAENAMGHVLAEYAAKEKDWHVSLGLETIETSSSRGEFKQEIVMKLLSMNDESMRRCLQVLPENKQGEFVQELFCPAEGSEGALASLLEYIGSYTLGSIDTMLQKYYRDLESVYKWKDIKADQVSVRIGVQNSFGNFLETVSTAAEIIVATRGHYDRDIDPILRKMQPELANHCQESLKGLENALELQISVAMKDVQKRLLEKLMNTLWHIQLKSDFLMNESGEHIENCTSACERISLIIREIILLGKKMLKGKNFVSTVSQIRDGFEQGFEEHILRYSFTPGGALRLRTDLDEYSKAWRESGIAALRTSFDELRTMTNILIVGPSSVHEMVEAVSYLDKERIKRILEKRPDYKSLYF